MLTLERNVQRQNRLLIVTLFDSATIAFACGAAMLTVTVYNLRSAIPPVEQVVEMERNDLAQGAAALPGGIPSTYPLESANEFNLLERLLASGNNAQSVGEARKQMYSKWSSSLDGMVREELTFWEARSRELCQGAKVPDTPTLLGNRDKPPVAFMSDLTNLAAYRAQVWQQYDHCREESKVVLDEDLLHFTYDESERFDMTPDEVARAEQMIRDYVDRHFALGMHKVYILGHCDIRGTIRRNYELSYGRAWHVANVVLDHLTSKGLTEGKEFMLIPIGMGASRPLACTGTECDSDDYHRRCRRIELAFQKLTPTDRDASKKIGRQPSTSEMP